MRHAESNSFSDVGIRSLRTGPAAKRDPPNIGYKDTRAPYDCDCDPTIVVDLLGVLVAGLGFGVYFLVRRSAVSYVPDLFDEEAATFPDSSANLLSLVVPGWREA
jgi:hypothetical protein